MSVPGRDARARAAPRTRSGQLGGSARRLAAGLLVFASACTPAPSGTSGEAREPERAAPRRSAGGTAPAPPAASADPAPSPSPSAPPVDDGPPPAIAKGGPRSVKGQLGVVVSVESEASRAGARVLEAGGNAVDAAVAVAFVLAVTHPSAGNLGGGGFMLVRPKGGPTRAIDYRETAPARLPRDEFDRMIADGGRGARSVGVPGTVRGLALAHERYGKLPWRTLVEPARRLAERGHRVGPREALTFSWNWKRLKQDPAARAEFGDRGNPRKEKDLLVRKDLAKTLARIADKGAAGFYEDETATAIASTLAQAGGTLTTEDLRAYRAKLRSPLELEYRGLTVETMPPPSAGGVALLELLGILSHERARTRAEGSAEAAHLFLEASRRAQAERRFAVVDPDAIAPGELARRLARVRDVPALLARVPIDAARATPSEKVHPLFEAALREHENTTHFSVIDADGMAVSCTTTLSSGFGSALVVPGTGIVLNNAVASFGALGDNQPVGGRRTVSSMAPTLVTREGELLFVLGSPGGDTIPSTIAQVFRNLVDYGMPLERAVEAPRLHHGFVPDEVRYERARPPTKATLAGLRKLGHVISKKTIPIGDANDLVVVDGVAYGFADPREGGLAVAARAKAR
jgi:gamma-glutamyltranspeptidase/glutathione hydrolase